MQNTNSVAVTYAIEVNFHLIAPVVPATNAIFISSITYTNIGGMNGFLLTWFAPTNDIFQVQETGSLTPPQVWNTFSNIITYAGPPTPTNGKFTFFDNGSQFPFGPMRFYRLLLLQVTNTLTLPQTNSVAAGSLTWLAVDVPTNADWATNILLFATNFPVNVLFTTNFPPATNGAAVLMSDAVNGVSILGTNTAPTNIVQGGVYYLGVQNTNSVAVTYAIEVNFHLIAPAVPATNADFHQQHHLHEQRRHERIPAHVVRADQ